MSLSSLPAELNNGILRQLYPHGWADDRPGGRAEIKWFLSLRLVCSKYDARSQPSTDLLPETFDFIVIDRMCSPEAFDDLEQSYAWEYPPFPSALQMCERLLLRQIERDCKRSEGSSYALVDEINATVDLAIQTLQAPSQDEMSIRHSRPSSP